MSDPDGQRKRESAGFEERDVSVWTLVSIATGLVVMIILLMLVTDAWQESITEAPEPSTPVEAWRPFPAPRLEGVSDTSFEDYETRQRGILTSYAWIDREDGRLRLPIERAMELIVDEGIPISGMRVTRLEMLQRKAGGGETP